LFETSKHILNASFLQENDLLTSLLTNLLTDLFLVKRPAFSRKFALGEFWFDVNKFVNKLVNRLFSCLKLQNIYIACLFLVKRPAFSRKFALDEFWFDVNKLVSGLFTCLKLQNMYLTRLFTIKWSVNNFATKLVNRSFSCKNTGF